MALQWATLKRDIPGRLSQRDVFGWMDAWVLITWLKCHERCPPSSHFACGTPLIMSLRRVEYLVTSRVGAWPYVDKPRCDFIIQQRLTLNNEYVRWNSHMSIAFWGLDNVFFFIFVSIIIIFAVHKAERIKTTTHHHLRATANVK